MWGEWRLPIAYEILDTAIERYVPGPSTTWIEFTREQISSGGAIYHLHQRLLGDLGKITIRKVSATETTMLIKRPEYPRRSPTPEEMASIKAIEDKDEYREALVALLGKIDMKCHALYLRRVEHQEKVIEAMFSRMAADPCGPKIEAPKKRGGRPRMEEQDDWDDIVDKVHKYLGMVKTGTESEAAAAFAGGVTARTMRNRMARMRSLGMNVYDE